MAGQTAATPAAKADNKVSANAKTPWGDPDLQGTWTSDDTWGVPFERPKTVRYASYADRGRVEGAREERVTNSEEFVETGGTNHSPAKAEIGCQGQGRSCTPAATGQVRPRRGCRAGSRTLGRVRAPSIASDFADRRPAGWPAASVDARSASRAGREDEIAARSRFRRPRRIGATMTAASRAAWPVPFCRWFTATAWRSCRRRDTWRFVMRWCTMFALFRPTAVRI